MTTTLEPPAPGTGPVAILVATKKGAFVLRSDPGRTSWAMEGPHFLGHIVHHAVLDPRDRRTLLLAARTGHLGPTVFRSTDLGKSWEESSRPPAFTRAPDGRVVHHVFWLEPGHPSEPGVWYAGTSPEGLFRSEDGGATWAPTAFHDHPKYPLWTIEEEGPGTPDGSLLHSICVDPRDPGHLTIGMSGGGGGVFESTDGGRDWRPLNENCLANFNPDPYPEYGQDPHCVRQHPLAPDFLYQQNHCGIYRLERPATRWERIGDAMPRDVGDVGFPVTLHPRDPDTVWVFPMDGTDVWPRVSPGGRAAVFRTRDAGASWERQDAGLPAGPAWWTVLRQAMSADAHDPVGVYLGTTCGEVWGSADEGASWSCLARHLPHVYAVEAVELDG